jgi:phosphate-selective porin OprO/OprP
MKKFLFILLFIVLYPSIGLCDEVKSESTPPTTLEAEELGAFERYYSGWMEMAEKGVGGGKYVGYHMYWSDGLHIDSREKNVRFLFNTFLIVDGGGINPDAVLNSAFPDLEGSDIFLRRFDLISRMELYDFFEAKLAIDFANIQEIKDNWWRFPNTPFLEKFTFGHFKEPFSLEELDSIRDRSFLEPALPTRAFTPGRNIGIDYLDVSADDRKTWALGAFINTGSFSDFGDARSKISEAFGIDVTGRFTMVPWYKDFGRRLFHFGFNYSHFFAETSNSEPNLQYRSRPETRITDVRLVDTGKLFAKGADYFGVEFASVLGPLSYQGEYMLTLTDIPQARDPYFWGFYFYGSYFLTGENRNYNVTNGRFSPLRPNSAFHLRKGGKGAWELASRFSFIDLNDELVRGGKELNFTAGVNWYPTRKTRCTLNYIRAHVEKRLNPPIRKGNANILQARFQIVF